MPKTTQEKLSALGYSMQEANEYVHAMVNMGQAQGLANKVAGLGINAQDLANIVNVSKKEVLDYFHYSGVDANLLNAENTGKSLVNDSSGDVYLYDQLTGKGKLVVEFGTQIGDIKTDSNGDIYAVGVLTGDIYRYDFSEQKIDRMDAQVGVDTRSMGMFDGMLVTGSQDTLHLLDKSANTLQELKVPVIGPPAGANSDLLVIGDKLYRNSTTGLTETDINTGVSTEITKALNFFTAGMVNAGDGWIIGYMGGFDEKVTAFNVNTKTVMELPVWDDSVPAVWGASEALQMHVDFWGLPT